MRTTMTTRIDSFPAEMKMAEAFSPKVPDESDLDAALGGPA